DLMKAVAYAVQHRRRGDVHSRRLSEYLDTAYAVPRETFAQAARAWETFVAKRKRMASPSLPSIIEMLSVLDTICQEGMNLGPAARPPGGTRSARLNLDALELRRVRDRVQTALIEEFGRLQARRRPRTFDRFVAGLSRDDVVITTNWDLLLDRALDQRFGAPRNGASLGAPLAGFERPAREKRRRRASFRDGPLLLKLHGSLDWLWCTQCGG